MANPVPPVALQAGQHINWALPTLFWTGCDNSSGANNGTAYADVNGGYAQMTGSGPLAQGHSFDAKWYGFQTPALPSGSVINAVYPVIICKSTPCPLGDYYAVYGQSLGGPTAANTFSNGTDFPGLNNLSDANGWADTQLNWTDIGASGIANAGIGVTVTGSQSSGGNVNWTITADYVALAVYYTPPPRPKNQVWVSVANTRLPKQ